MVMKRRDIGRSDMIRPLTYMEVELRLKTTKAIIENWQVWANEILIRPLYDQLFRLYLIDYGNRRIKLYCIKMIKTM